MLELSESRDEVKGFKSIHTSTMVYNNYAVWSSGSLLAVVRGNKKRKYKENILSRVMAVWHSISVGRWKRNEIMLKRKYL